MDRLLNNKVAIVTGGGQGIGAAICRTFVKAGARVAVCDIQLEPAQGVVDSLGVAAGDASAFEVDVRDIDAVNHTCRAAVEMFGTVDILVNNAGIDLPQTIETMSHDDWCRVLDINLTGAFNFTRSVIAYMRGRGGGSIVNMSSAAAKRMAYNGGAHYTASKAGLIGFTRHAAVELAAYGIRVNAVCPGPVATPMMEGTSTDIMRLLPLGRWVDPQDVADAVLFFAGPLSKMCTGTNLDVDGGYLITFGIPFEEYFGSRDDSISFTSRDSRD